MDIDDQKTVAKARMMDRRDGRNHYQLDVYLAKSGRIVLEGYDIGPFVERTWGDSDYEYWRTIDAQYMPEILVHLIADHFETDTAFAKWLEELGVPSAFQCWT